jgi:hypothetical protein
MLLRSSWHSFAHSCRRFGSEGWMKNVPSHGLAHSRRMEDHSVFQPRSVCQCPGVPSCRARARSYRTSRARLAQRDKPGAEKASLGARMRERLSGATGTEHMSPNLPAPSLRSLFEARAAVGEQCTTDERRFGMTASARIRQHWLIEA